MLSPEKKRELLSQAETLAAELAGGQVTRAEWRYVVDALYLAPGAGRSSGSRARAEELIEALPGSWVKNRSQRTQKQLERVRQVYGQVARRRLGDEELRYLVGWTSRLLYVRGRGARGGKPGGGRRHGHRPRHGRR